MKTKGRIIDKGGKKSKPSVLDEKRVGVSVPVLITTQGVQFGMQEYMSAAALSKKT